MYSVACSRLLVLSNASLACARLNPISISCTTNKQTKQTNKREIRSIRCVEGQCFYQSTKITKIKAHEHFMLFAGSSALLGCPRCGLSIQKEIRIRIIIIIIIIIYNII